MPLPIALCALAAAGLVAIGTLALLSPQRLARTYGITVTAREGLAYVRATGARDVIIGALFGVSVYLQDTLSLLLFCGAGLLLSLADFCIAFFMGGRRFRSELGAHLGGALAFIVLLALLRR